MFRLWGKEFKDNRMLKDLVICDESDDTRTHKIFHALDEICYEFDLSKPLWLDSTINEFKRHSRARFYQDSFIDEIDFDYLIRCWGQKPPTMRILNFFIFLILGVDNFQFILYN
jgi:hypothetical protein